MPLQRRLDNRYEIRESLGRGGMAEVYLAHDRVLERDVALKVLNSCYAEDGEFVRRFRREARSAASLSHPNVVSIHDLGEIEGAPGEPTTYYIAMEYVSGVSLWGLLKREGRLPVADAVAVARQVAEGLGAAHDRGIVHRDIKPHNILLAGTGEEGVSAVARGGVKVADFGIARAAGSEAVTGTGEFMGTAHYLSPEQVMGGEATPRSDLYALGVVLYEALTGRRPYDADHPFGVAMQHVTGDLVPPKHILPDLPEELNCTVVRLLGKDPEERHRDAGELISDLDALPGRAEDGATGEASGGNRPRASILVPICALIVLTTTLWGVQQGFGLSGLTGEVRHGVESILRGVDDGGDNSGPDTPAGEAPSIFGEEPAERGAGRGGAGEPSRQDAPKSGSRQDEAPDARKESGSPESGSGAEPEGGASEEDSPEDGAPQATGDAEADEEARNEEDGSAGGGGSREADEAVYVPELAGQSVEAARETLQSTGFRVSGVVQEPGSRPEGVVLRTDPPAGSALEPGSGVTIVASSGPGDPPNGGGPEGSGPEDPAGEPGAAPEDEEAVTVPDVSGRQSGQAVAILESAGLRAEVRGAFGGEDSGTVVSSDPPAGSRVEEGALITLTVLDESSPSIATEPGESGEDQYPDQYEGE